MYYLTEWLINVGYMCGNMYFKIVNGGKLEIQNKTNYPNGKVFD